MGWASGSRLADQIWDIIKPHIPTYQRYDIAQEIIDVFEGEDCDTMCETQLYQEIYIYDKDAISEEGTKGTLVDRRTKEPEWKKWQ